jgi:hypothetical protein
MVQPIQRVNVDVNAGMLEEQCLRAEPAAVGSLADEALDEHRHGLTRPLDELIGRGR